MDLGSSSRRRVFSFAVSLACFLTGTEGPDIPRTEAQEPTSDAANAPGNAWVEVQVPQAWRSYTRGAYGRNRGFRWFRCGVSIPDSWRDRKIQLFVESVDDAREYYLNGKPILKQGQMPPRFRSGLGDNRYVDVASDALKFGDVNTLAIRVYHEDGRNNFNVAAPAFFAESEALTLAGNWMMRLGDQREAAMAAWEGPPSFEKIEAAEALKAKLTRLAAEIGPLPPQESLQHLTTLEDLNVTLALAEPDVCQPLSIKFDERGRMWVVQYRQYPNPAGLKMVSRDMFLRTVYDKVPNAPPNHVRGEDRITIHEDRNGDGYYEHQKVFVDGLNLATSVALGRGGVWVLNPPYLLFYPDQDQDDVPDGPPEVHLQGFGLEDSHSICNSLRWGPDGWLYAAQGSTVTAHVTRPGRNDDPVHSMGQLIWRYHPARRKYEIFAEGGGNAFGVEIDSKGRIYSGHNGGDTRGFHYVQGGYFRKGFGKHGALSNPYAFGYFEAMKHHKVARFTHTFVIYEEQGLPADYLGKLFGVGPLQSHVVYSEVHRDGSSFRTSDLGHPLASRDTWCRPVDIQPGPDGALYVADFYEQRIDHASHYQGRVDKQSGRIYRIAARQESARTGNDGASLNLRALSSAELLDVLAHPSRWHRQTALRLLGDRGEADLAPELLRRLERADGQQALEWLWALNAVKGLSSEQLAQLLSHADPHVRRWVVRLACDDGHVSDRVAEELVQLADREADVETRTQLASSARRLPVQVALPIVGQLLRHDDDINDVYQPLLLWWALEAKCQDHADEVLKLFRSPEIWTRPIVQQAILSRLMRRFAATGQQIDLRRCAALLASAPDQAAKARLLQGFENAFEGRPLALLPDSLVQALAESGEASLTLRLRQGDSAAVNQALELVTNPKGDAQTRLQCIQVLAELRLSAGLPVLLNQVVREQAPPIREAMVAALAHYDSESIPDRLLSRLAAWPPSTQEVAIATLCSRQTWALRLVTAVEQEQIRKELLDSNQLRRMLLFDDATLQRKVRQVWGAVEGATTSEMRARIAELSNTIAEASGNPYVGKQLYKESCGKCHRLFEEGGWIGPDLTSYQRSDLTRILTNVVNPSQEIREGFETFLVLTADGRALSGFIEDQNESVIVLKSAEGTTQVLPRNDIEAMKATPKSLMPEGLLDKYSAEQIRDLFAYLRATQPLN